MSGIPSNVCSVCTKPKDAGRMLCRQCWSLVPFNIRQLIPKGSVLSENLLEVMVDAGYFDGKKKANYAAKKIFALVSRRPRI